MCEYQSGTRTGGCIYNPVCIIQGVIFYVQPVLIPSSSDKHFVTVPCISSIHTRYPWSFIYLHKTRICSQFIKCQHFFFNSNQICFVSKLNRRGIWRRNGGAQAFVHQPERVHLLATDTKGPLELQVKLSTSADNAKGYLSWGFVCHQFFLQINGR